MELSSRCTAEGPTAGGDRERVGGDFIRKPTLAVGWKEFKEYESDSTNTTEVI